ncbi:MAG TPA: hypothetical protein VEW47_11455 [Candidatus Dormibacteraeota bacterium]|nr:hypothetical protein [Candidatus Dormibacteraeota bacterium]
MKRALIGSTALAGVLVIAVMVTPVFAACVNPTPLQHLLGGWFSNCTEPVRAFAFGVSSNVAPDTTCPNGAASCNTGSVLIACPDAGSSNGQLAGCQPDAGTPNDGNVTILFDWGGGGSFTGCPNPAQAANIGRNYVQVVDAKGKSLFVTVPYSFDLGAYALDLAQPDTFPAGPISCTTNEAGLTFRSFTGGTLCGNMPVPRAHTDCDPGTWGVTGGNGFIPPTCQASTLFPLNRGKLYRKDTPADASKACTGADPVLSTGAWTNIPIDPVANPNFASNGDFCVPTPPPAAGQCAHFGATGMVNGVETPAMVGDLDLGSAGDPNAPSPRAVQVSANAGGNSVSISFRTEGELGLVGFNVLADAQGGKNRIKVNSALIDKKGVEGGGASYSVQIPKGNFKGAKVLYIESVLTSGTLLSDPASF